MIAALALILLKEPSFRPSALFGDGMVLQRDLAVPIFGEAAPGSTVSVQFRDQNVETVTSPEGRWSVRLSPLKAGGPFKMILKSDETKIQRTVFVGEVWLCSGQSNMEWPVGKSEESEEMLKGANQTLRVFKVRRVSSPVAESNVLGTWASGTPKTLETTSAVAVSFANEIQKKLKVPVGIIQATWGGIKCEAWTSWRALEENAKLQPLVENYLDQLPGFGDRLWKYKQDLLLWEQKTQKTDPGNEGYQRRYADPKTSTDDWASVSLPDAWEVFEDKEIDGAVWYRYEFELPPEMVNQNLRLQLGQVNDADFTYMNGFQVGRSTKRSAKRAYAIGRALARPGRNVIAVRVWNSSGEGGILGPLLRLATMDDQHRLDLAGPWKTKVELGLEAADSDLSKRPVSPMGPGNRNAPSGPFQGMIAPLIPFAIRGVLWYQGEANVGEPERFASTFPTLIDDWRTRWKQASLPFFYVELAPFGIPTREPQSLSTWTDLRLIQAKVLDQPNTGMVSTADLGEPNKIHPRKKRQVGIRLANLAFERTYNLGGSGSSPRLRSFDYVGSTIRLRFENVSGAFRTNDGEAPRGFQLKDADGNWQPATARFEGVYIILQNSEIQNPRGARFAYADYPDTNVVSGAALPLGPFQI